MYEWIDKVTGFITSFTKFLDSKDNAQLIGYLEGGSGFLSLGAGIAKMIIDYKESQKTEYEKSITDLFAFLFPFTFDQIKTIIQSHGLNEKDLDFNQNELKSELKKYFSVYNSGFVDSGEIKSPWLPLHPLIQKFKNETIQWLSLGKDKSIIIADELKRSFEDKIEYDLYKKNELELFRKLVEKDLIVKELMKYLDLVIKDYQNTIEKEREHDLSAISNFGEMYVKDRKAIKLTINAYWNTTDSDIYTYHSDNIKNIDDLINDFLLDIDRRKLIIGANYGIGKTTLLKKLAYDYAKKRNEEAQYRIPIIVYLKNKLKIETREGEFESLDNFLIQLFGENDYGKKKIPKPVLFIFDALDEYFEQNNNIDELIESEIFKIVNQFSDYKIIFTTRLIPDYHALNKITVYYLRMLPFDKLQVNCFLRQKKSDLTFEKLNEILDAEIITIPLILLILVKAYPKLQEDFERLNKEKKITQDLIKTLLYMQMFYDHYYGKSTKTIEEQYINNIQISFKQEKKNLRLISYYTQIKKDLTVKEFKDWSKQPQLEVKNMDPVINTYFSYSKTDKYLNDEGNRKMTFIHQTYKEFLLAEYIIEQYVKGNPTGLNVGSLSEVTINFFRGFLDLLKSDNVTVEKFVIGDENNKNTFLYSLDYKPKVSDNILNEIKGKIINTAKESFNNDLVNILIIEEEDKITKSINSDKLKWYQSIQSDVNSYVNLWLHRWVSLIILGYLNHECIKELNKNKLIRLINASSHNVPIYVKYLAYVDLSYADLEFADLSGANLLHTNFSGANLSGANLSEALLDHTNLSNAYLYGALIHHATLTNVNLLGADLCYYSAPGFLKEIPAKGQHRFFSAVNLSGAIFRGSILSYTNLSEANLSNTVMTNIQSYKGIILNKETDFLGSIIDDPNFIKILQNNSCKNIPNVIKNKKELREKLTKTSIDKDMIDNLVSISQLPED